jgi:hypothetical protein
MPLTQSRFTVLKTIGVPNHIQGNSTLKVTDYTLEQASLNKIRLFYLALLNGRGQIGELESELTQSNLRRQKILDLAVCLSHVFEKSNLPYAVMKTLKPFPYEGSDVDVLVGSPSAFSQAINALKKDNFTLLGSDLFSATLYRKDFDANVDLQLELSVSGLPYLEKTALLTHSSPHSVNGVPVVALDDVSEVLVSAAHAFYKEHMFTLADFYSVALWLENVDVDALCELAKQTNCELALASLLSWIHRTTLEPLEHLCRKLTLPNKPLDNPP